MSRCAGRGARLRWVTWTRPRGLRCLQHSQHRLRSLFLGACNVFLSATDLLDLFL